MKLKIFDFNPFHFQTFYQNNIIKVIFPFDKYKKILLNFSNILCFLGYYLKIVNTKSIIFAI